MVDASNKSWDEYRQAMLDETSRFIEWGLAHPEMVIEIPAKPVGAGGFTRAMADWFWGVALATRQTPLVQRWQDFLRRLPKGRWRRQPQ
jgi:hypothetical protein